MGFALVIFGLILWLLGFPTLGLILIVVGLLALFLPAGRYPARW